MKFCNREKIFWIGTAVFVFFSYFYFSALHSQYLSVNSFEECVSAHFIVLPTYPETCIMPGKRFANKKQVKDKEVVAAISNENNALPYENLVYTIEGQSVSFTNSVGIQSYDSSLNKATTTYGFIGKPFIFNGSSDERDNYLVIAEASSTEGIVGYYVFAALSLRNSYTGTNGLYLGKKLYSVLYSATTSSITIKTKEAINSKEVKHVLVITRDNLLEEMQP